MDARRSYFVWGISLTALTSLIVGVAALGVVLFLLDIFSNNLSPGTLATEGPAISRNLLQVIVTWPGVGFLLALAGIIAGFSAIPEKGSDNRTQVCKWMCRLGIGLCLLAIFADMLIILYLHAVASVLGAV
jgi:hypothetical protein